jgi:hypothetical protein
MTDGIQVFAFALLIFPQQVGLLLNNRGTTSQADNHGQFFKPGKVKRILAEHVLEHLNPLEAEQAIQNF